MGKKKRAQMSREADVQLLLCEGGQKPVHIHIQDMNEELLVLNKLD